jgi:hypothetical protein
MDIILVEQNTPEWDELRRGKITSSAFSNIITGTGKPSASRDKYLLKVAAGAVFGVVDGGGFSSYEMRRGHLLQPEATASYCFANNAEVATEVFCVDDTGFVGASPDGLIENEKGGLEIKCRNIDLHLAAMREKEFNIMTGDIPQVQGCLWLTKYEWWDYMWYYPGLPDLIVRVYPDREYHEKLDNYMGTSIPRLIEFINEFKHKYL